MIGQLSANPWCPRYLEAGPAAQALLQLAGQVVQAGVELEVPGK